jgi:hypothetical protein
LPHIGTPVASLLELESVVDEVPVSSVELVSSDVPAVDSLESVEEVLEPPSSDSPEPPAVASLVAALVDCDRSGENSPAQPTR